MSEASKKIKRKRMLSPKEFKDYEEKLYLRYGWLMVQQMEFERKVRKKLISLGRKTKKQSRLWVI